MPISPRIRLPARLPTGITRATAPATTAATPRCSAFWTALNAAGAEIVLSGHSHDYERFAPKDADGKVSPAGVRQFVVGTGGAFFTGLGTSRVAGSEVSQNDTFGVLKLTLHAASYDWRFVPIAGSGWTDSGSTRAMARAARPWLLRPRPPGRPHG